MVRSWSLPGAVRHLCATRDEKNNHQCLQTTWGIAGHASFPSSRLALHQPGLISASTLRLSASSPLLPPSLPSMQAHICIRCSDSLILGKKPGQPCWISLPALCLSSSIRNHLDIDALGGSWWGEAVTRRRILPVCISEDWRRLGGQILFKKNDWHK